jgi:hypothetical protein
MKMNLTMKKLTFSPIKLISGMTVILGLLFVSSCKKDVGPIIIPPANAPPVSFASEIQPIFTTNCAVGGCHDGSAYDPNLSAGVAYVNTVNVPAPSYAPYFLIRPSKADSSVIYHKMLNDDAGTYGGKMPPAGTLPATQLDLLKTWINQGALNN